METHTNLSLTEFKNQLTKCSGKRVSLDTETTGLNYFRDRLTTVGFHCPDAGVEGSIDSQPQEEMQAAVKESLAPGTTTIFHNAKFDLSFLDADPNLTGWKIIDTTVIIHLYDSRLRKGLEAAEKTLLGSNSKRQAVDDTQFPQPDLFAEDGKKKRGKPKVWDWHPDKRQAYCINDCRVTYQLAERMIPLLRKHNLEKLFSMQMLYLRDLYSIEHLGIQLDLEFMGKCRMALQKDLKEMEQQLYSAAGREFNYRSTVQLSHVLYDELGWPRPVNPFTRADGTVSHSKFAGKGQFNKTMTSSFILLEKAKHPLGELISSIRETAKFIKTLDQWMDLKDEQDVLHANFNLTGTRTGRLSCSKPNLQNIPSVVRNIFVKRESIRTDEYSLRKSFVARPGYAYLSIDYSQMEIRFFGWLSQDPNMLKVLQEGGDLHATIAKQVWGVSDKAKRQQAKAVTFGLIYGASAGSLQFRLGLSRQESIKVTDDYWAAFPRVKPWMEEVQKECKEKGYLTYWSGRLWREEDEEEMYKGVNALIQGGMADMLAVAEMRVAKWFRENPVGRIVNIIHDEFLMEIEVDKLESTADTLSGIMEVEDLFDLPFTTECKTGDSYGNLSKMELFEGKWRICDGKTHN
jgi:DNA polymerase I